ncbi:MULTISPECIES: arginine repressor [unclassified Fusibacter]|uniref:arginine repressor n=1 Tax=unclassified Fusibacter TaxID=2624464 RepID=UPI0010108499|nr:MULTISPECIES: arginine repressor [unclassified Fusibacter]MCK8058878.1 arginine repressor [Fusibacter sp. A2]NPE21953.1 arginine repressor [Fusibacter sp. A1]RXV61521.1 arginine repressor [Fusibacter sp. A1]
MKYARHSKIVELIDHYEIETQEELAGKLNQEGFKVTQATVSRDIKELRLIKVLTKTGRYKYASIQQQDAGITDRFIKIFKDSLINIDSAGNMIVIKTLPGAAQAAAAALDALDQKEIVGTLAGDDTIFLVVRHVEEINNVIHEFMNMTK